MKTNFAYEILDDAQILNIYKMNFIMITTIDVYGIPLIVM